MTKIELKLIPDLNIYISFEKEYEVVELRGGISYTSNRNSKANIKYLKSYDPKQESKHIIYLDVHNLYGYVMSKFIPASGFKCIDPKSILNILKSYENYKMIILQLQIKQKSKVKCCLSIYERLLIYTIFYIPIGNLVPNILKEKIICFMITTYNFT